MGNTSAFNLLHDLSFPGDKIDGQFMLHANVQRVEMRTWSVRTKLNGFQSVEKCFSPGEISRCLFTSVVGLRVNLPRTFLALTMPVQYG